MVISSKCITASGTSFLLWKSLSKNLPKCINKIHDKPSKCSWELAILTLKIKQSLVTQEILLNSFNAVKYQYKSFDRFKSSGIVKET